ncbi:uncharacterized protein LOC143540008 [Bidens hawaiensis]|uniref:uncharacterized protein LOC143540008 n=1 Tax=Bidens hawaiensis TaxID=980011 RepID=UPI00404A7486
MSTSTVTDMNHGGSKPSGRRKTKATELTQKKPKRGMGVAQLENLRKITEAASQNPNHHLQQFINNNHAAVLQYYRVPMFHDPNVYSVDPNVIGVSNGGFRFENTRDRFYSVPSYMKCASDGCGICHKKKRIAGGLNHSSVSPFRSFSGSNTVVEIPVAGKTRGSSRQVTEVMPVNRSGGGSMTEFEFFPGKGGESMTATASTWCCSCASVGGPVGLRGGEGSCVTAMSASEEGSVSSVDLSLKLSY